MASEYLKWKYKDVQPDKPLVLTKKQKRQNWWHYHKWHVVIGAVLLIAAMSILLPALGVGVIKPDYQIAYVGAAPLPDDTVAAVESSLAAFGEDLNGDGKVVIKLNQYPTDANEEGADALSYAAASSIRLMGDLENRQSGLFILENAETFHSNYDVLADSTGAIARYKEDVDIRKWSSCPVLDSIELGKYTETILGRSVTGSSDELLADLYIARYGTLPDVDFPAFEAYDALWNALTKGAEK